MIEVKGDFRGGLNLDDSLYIVPKNSYVDAFNITRDAIEGSNDMSITNVVGNRIVDYALPSGRNVCIGSLANPLRNTIIYFIWNENNYDLILQYNNTSRTIIPIFSNLTDSDGVDILEFTENDKITGINIYPRDEGDLLFFLDSLGRPTTIDIEKFISGTYIPVTRDIINVCKNPPLAPPSNIYSTDTSRRTNSVRNKLFRFKYRWVYDNNEKSTCSPISVVPLPSNILDNQYNSIITNNNKIDLLLDSGAKDVKAVELLMSYVNKTNIWSDFYIVDTVNKDDITLLSAVATPYIDLFVEIQIAFSGSSSIGTVINIYLTQLAGGGQVLVGTYTTVAGDVIQNIIDGLILSIIATGLTFLPYYVGNNLYLGWNTNIYAFDEVTVTNFDVNNVTFGYSFYNDSTYPLLNVEESIQLFDYVPDLAKAQEMPNGNVLMYGAITEGYDNDLVPNVINTILTIPRGNDSSLGSLSVDIQSITTFGYYESVLTFSGNPLAGTAIRIYTTSGATLGTYLTQVNDGLQQITDGLRASMNQIGNVAFVSNNGGVMQVKSALFLGGPLSSIVPPNNNFASNSIPTFPFSTARQIGIAYFDKKGKTNGIVYNSTLSFPAYSENGGRQTLCPYINTKIYHTPPEWAWSYNFYLTKEPTEYIYWCAIKIIRDTNGIDVYIDISNFKINQRYNETTTNVLSYTFQDGDRVRLIREGNPTGPVYSDNQDASIDGVIEDPKISGSTVVGQFIKVTNFTGLLNNVFNNQNIIIQIYRPEQQLPNNANAVFYEYGAQYYIGDPELPTRYHKGQVTDQVFATNTPAEFNFYDGDAYFRVRSVKISESGYRTYNALDRNFVDIYISAVNSIDGRPNVIDINAKRAYYSTLVRFGGAYQANTNINALNRFFPNNFDEYDYSYGDIMRFKVRDRFVRVFQKFKVGQVPLYNQILKELNKENLVVTDRLLNPIQYYIGDIGIGDNAESLASYNFADYFTSNVKGVIARVSNDGVKFLSVEHKVNSWATDFIPLRSGNYKIYGAFDQRLGNYICALEATDTDIPRTILWDEENNSFETFMGYYPEMMVTLGVLLVMFKDGKLYTHDSEMYNTFFGTTQDSTFTPVFNEKPLDKKTFETLTEVASEVWEVPEIMTDLNSYGNIKMQTNMVTQDFEQLEGSFEGAILRDINSQGGIIEGDTMKGKYITTKFKKSQPTSLVSLNLISLKYINSPLNTR